MLGLQNSDWLGLLVPGVLLLAVGAFTVIALALTVHRKSVAWGIVTGLSVIALVASTVAAGVVFTRLVKKQTAKNSQWWLVSSEDGRHHMKVPGHWKKETDLGDDPAIQVANRMREQYMMLFAYPRDGSVSLQDWATAVNEEIGSNVENAVISPLEERTVNEFPARFSQAAGRVEGVNALYHITYLELPEHFAYVLCWTLKGREKAAFPIFDQVVKSYTYKPVEAPALITYDKSAPVPERVRVLIANQLGKPLEQVMPDAKIVDLGADELDTVELVMALEEEFGGEIGDDVAEKFVTVADAIRWAEAQPSVPDPEAVL